MRLPTLVERYSLKDKKDSYPFSVSYDITPRIFMANKSPENLFDLRPDMVTKTFTLLL
jgi:hypothetical protein